MGKRIFKRPALLVVFVIIVLIIIIKPAAALTLLKNILHILSPVFIGMAIAFVMNRPVFRLEKIFSSLSKTASKKLITSLAVFTGYFILIGLITGIICIIVPQLIKSIRFLISNFDLYYDNLLQRINTLEKRDTIGIIDSLTGLVSSLNENIPVIAEKIYAKTSNFIGLLINFIIGFIISIYILADKQGIKKAVMELTRAVTTSAGFERSGRYYRLVFDTFTRFVSGQVTESLILGILCFLGMKLLRFDYALLISTLIGITAVIPVVGAFIGTIPAAFLLFLVDPMQAVWFVVFIIILQQLENNLIYPRVVGKSLGLPSILVLVSILIGAGIGGITGILLGVPLAAVLYAVICDYVHTKNGTDDCMLWQRGDEVV